MLDAERRVGGTVLRYSQIGAGLIARAETQGGTAMAMVRVLVTLAGLVSAFPFAAHAQDWPNRPVRMIVPFAAGGSTDVAARLVAENLSRALGQQVIVENRPGANGNIGTEAVAKSAPDGYTLLVTPEAVTSNPHVYKVNYDALKEFTPVIQLSRQPVVLAVHPSLGVSTLAELVALAKREPGQRYGTGSGVGSGQHMVTQWFAQIAGIQLEQVAYRGGGQAINDLIAGHVKIGTLGSTPLIPHYKAGTLKLLAQTTAARSSTLPDVPTFQEAGIRGLVFDQWLGVLAPAGTSPAIIARLNSQIGKALEEPAIRNNFLQSAQDPVGGTADAFGQLMRNDFAKFEKLVKELDIKVN
jgi:tripartite-type tricarboxylate transporter receptor subunit TctC